MTVLVIYAKLLLKMSLKCLNFFFLLTWTFSLNSPIQNLFIFSLEKLPVCCHHLLSYNKNRLGIDVRIAYVEIMPVLF